LLQLHRRSKPARCGTCGTCLGFDGIAQSRCPRASARATNDWP
jgi:predicted Zn-ribbon and HTH transcriptional regulator